MSARSELEARAAETLATARRERTPEAMRAAADASAALSAHLVAAGGLPKGARRASRAGQRQAAERRAFRG